MRVWIVVLPLPSEHGFECFVPRLQLVASCPAHNKAHLDHSNLSFRPLFCPALSQGSHGLVVFLPRHTVSSAITVTLQQHGVDREVMLVMDGTPWSGRLNNRKILDIASIFMDDNRHPLL